MLVKINPDNPNPRGIAKIIECLQDGGIIIYPTDTIYGIGCDIFKKSCRTIAKMKKYRPKKAKFLIYMLRFEPTIELYITYK